MTTWQKRLTALFLSVLMLAASFSLTAFAEEKEDEEDAEIGDVINAAEEEDADVNLSVNRYIAPKKIKITGSKYVAKGKKIKLKVEITPAKANKKVTWKSNNPAVATVDKKGNVKGISPGKAVITVTSAVNGKKQKSFAITVTEVPVKKVIILGYPEEMTVGDKVSLKTYHEPKKAAKSFTWKSLTPDVAKVDSKGRVTAVSPGTAIILATATDGSKKKATATIQVKRAAPPRPTPPAGRNYRALLIGEQRHLGRNSYGSYIIDDCTRNSADMNHMAAMLGQVYAADGAQYQVTTKKDATYADIQSLIQTTFAGTTENDVSLFFIATHGNSSGDGELAMSFLGNPSSYDDRSDYYKNSTLSFSTLASWLNTYVKGEVIVLIESCGAGSAIYDPSEGENQTKFINGGAWSYLNGPDTEEMNPKAEQSYSDSAFVSKAIRAFSSRDHSFTVTNGEGQGALRQNKFYVMAASRHQQNSYGFEYTDPNQSHNAFTNWLIAGAYGGADSMGNGDFKITLTELFSYINYRQENSYSEYGEYIDQRVQRYPVGSQYEMFWAGGQ